MTPLFHARLSWCNIPPDQHTSTVVRNGRTAPISLDLSHPPVTPPDPFGCPPDHANGSGPRAPPPPPVAVATATRRPRRRHPTPH
eukprot:4961737-Pyramimonas_sp.AAC.1